jgi:hypothetical protein
MRINQSIDIEDEIRQALDPYLTAYVRPLPAEYDLPNILITQVGGTTSQTIDTFAVVLDARANTEATAINTLNKAVGILKQVAKEQTSALRHVTVNTSGSWGNDPVRPDLAMCSARLEIVAHQVKQEVNANGS